MSHHKMKPRKALLQKTVLLYPIVVIIPYELDKSKSIRGIDLFWKNIIKMFKQKTVIFLLMVLFIVNVVLAITRFI